MKKYLIVSSVLLHVVVLISLVWAFPTMFRVWQESSKDLGVGGPLEVGRVVDASLLIRDKHSYTSYLIDIDGQKVCVPNMSDQKYRAGDEVQLSITKHPYEKLNTLVVTVSGIKE